MGSDTAVQLLREGRDGVEVLHTVYQYNHQSGTLYLPLTSKASSPVAIKVRGAPERNLLKLQQTLLSFLSQEVLGQLDWQRNKRNIDCKRLS